MDPAPSEGCDKAKPALPLLAPGTSDPSLSPQALQNRALRLQPHISTSGRLMAAFIPVFDVDKLNSSLFNVSTLS